MRLRGEVFKFCPGFLAQCFISNIRNVSYRCSGFSRKYLSPHFEFSLFRGLMKGFSLLVFITGPPQCITPAHYVALHACYCITAEPSVLCVLPRSGHQPSLSEAGSGDWRLSCQHYNLTTRPAASICRTCVFPSIRQHLTTLIHTFNNWFLPVKLSSFSAIIQLFSQNFSKV